MEELERILDAVGTKPEQKKRPILLMNYELRPHNYDNNMVESDANKIQEHHSRGEQNA